MPPPPEVQNAPRRSRPPEVQNAPRRSRRLEECKKNARAILFNNGQWNQ